MRSVSIMVRGASATVNNMSHLAIQSAGGGERKYLKKVGPVFQSCNASFTNGFFHSAHTVLPTGS